MGFVGLRPAYGARTRNEPICRTEISQFETERQPGSMETGTCEPSPHFFFTKSTLIFTFFFLPCFPVAFGFAAASASNSNVVVDW